MILSEETSDDGQPRIYFTQMASVVSYFTDHPDGGVETHVAPGEFACPWSTTAGKLDAVRLAMLAETARRLNCCVDQVETMSLADIAKVADPHLKHRHSWTGRSKARPRNPR
jgi:hypothetical protein